MCTTVTIEDVRGFLRELPEQLVPDTTIQKQIDFATWQVTKKKSTTATTADCDKCIEITAVYYSVLAYMAEAERSLGLVPKSLIDLANAYKAQMNDAWSIVTQQATSSTTAWDPSQGPVIYTNDSARVSVTSKDYGEPSS